ncbi:MAG: WYL domain-containing protein [Bacilli bacterium]|jgi:hypothetical protein|nr:WYL domain-containing protein [Bacilli bacterium]
MEESNFNYKNQYTLLVYLVLSKYSDEEHRITQTEILDYLKEDYGVETQRRSITRALNVLEHLEFDIIRTSKGVALGGRVFDEGQLEFVLDAIYSSPSISPSDAEKIFSSLTKTLSINERNRLASIEKMDERGRRNNPHIFYEIGAIAGAIQRRSLIEFTYNAYDAKGQLKPLTNNPQKVLPIKSYFRDGRYCLLAGSIEKMLFIRFYIDRMTDVKEIPQDNKHSITYSETAVKEYLAKHPHLGAGEVIEAEIEIEDERAFNSLFAYFWDVESTFITPDGKCHVKVKADEESILSWCFSLAGKVSLLSPKQSLEKLHKRVLSLLEKASLTSLDANTTPESINKETLLSQYDFEVIKDNYTFDKASLLAPSSSLPQIINNVSFEQLLQNKILSALNFSECFPFNGDDVQEFVSLFLTRRRPRFLGRVTLLKAGEKKSNHFADFQISHESTPYWVIGGKEEIVLGLFFLWRICYLGWENSECVNPNKSPFYSEKIASYYPQKEKTAWNQETMKEFTENIFYARGCNASDYQEAIDTIDTFFKNLSEQKIKRIIEGFEKMCRFDVVIYDCKI